VREKGEHMGENFLTFTSGESNISRITPPILKISTPKGVYDQKERKGIYESVKEQVGHHYLPVMVNEDVKLEIIDEF
jgi:hypothetical protein